ncbi:uncharacterized protein [Cherax quadricarinatus]|uniref:uncharacterized protein isoform X1 n=1 Tax=Cherax quadricarinatus TaxID=27406 RepID=UPI00387EB585
MADRQGRRVNTVCVAFTQGSLSVSTMHALMPCIIRDVYGIPNEELYGVALNGMSRMFIKFLNAGFYNKIVETFQERRMVVNSAVEVCLHDVPTYVTWVKVRNVPFEAEYDLRDVFGRNRTVHAATKGVWREGPYEGFPEGSFTIKMMLCQSIPSYVRLEKYRTQVFVHYLGQRKTCRLCNSFEHMAAQCPRRLVVHSRDHSPVGLRAEAFVTEPGTSAGQVPRLWSDEMQQEDTQSMMCAALSVDALTVPTLTVDPVRPEVLPQDKLLEDVLQDLLDGTEHGPVVSTACRELTTEESPNMEMQDKTTFVRTHEVVVEVHQEASSSEEMHVDGSSRKRSAGASDMDDVLTPGQHPGRKSWAKVAEPPITEGIVSRSQHKARVRGEGCLEKPKDKDGQSNVRVGTGKTQKHRGKSPFL